MRTSATIACEEFATTGVIETVAGEGGAGSFGDGLPATQALLNGPQAVAIDATGNLYIADSRNGLVREVTVDGNIHTIAAQLDFPRGLAISGDGSLFISQGAGIIKKLGTDGTISTFVTLPMASCDPGSITITPQASVPQQITFDSGGNLLVADSWVGVVDRVSPTGQLTTIAGFCGSSASGQLGDGGLATRAGLREPNAVTLDSAGNLYIADLGHNRIRKITADGTISTVAGGGLFPPADGGPATAATLSGGSYIASDPTGNLYQADVAGRIRKISLNGTITTIAGTGVEGFSGDGGAAANAQFNAPTGIAADGAGNVYVADSNNQRIRKIASNSVITTIAGNGTQGFSGDGGLATAAQLNNPAYLAADSAGNLWIYDSYNNRVRKISAAGIITTIAGNGKNGYSGDGPPAFDGGLATAGGIQLTSMGRR